MSNDELHESLFLSACEKADTEWGIEYNYEEWSALGWDGDVDRLFEPIEAEMVEAVMKKEPSKVVDLMVGIICNCYHNEILPKAKDKLMQKAKDGEEQPDENSFLGRMLERLTTEE
jgi:hypothetical protein